MVALNGFAPLLCVDEVHVVLRVANDKQHAIVIAVADDVDIAFFCRTDGTIAAFVVDACQLAGCYHRLDLCGVGQPVGHEHAGRARHGQQIGIGGQRVLQ